MCELLALAFNRPVSPNLSLRGFRHRAKKNPHGWGLAYYQDGAAQVFREPMRADDSALAAFLRDYGLQSQLYMGHVRRASAGSLTLRNCHPFCREMNGADITLMHNGTLRGDFRQRLRLGRYQPVGETDSEHVFCHLLAELDRRGQRLGDKDTWPWLGQHLRGINNYGDLNLIMSDGQNLLCYFDARGYNGLYYCYRQAPYDQVALRDEDWIADLRQTKDPDQRGFCIASQPLTDEVWTRLDPGELLVLSNGEMVFSNLRDIGEQARQRVQRVEDCILCTLRRDAHAVPLARLLQSCWGQVGADEDEALPILLGLVRQKYIRQDRRDTVPEDDASARYYTLGGRRDAIDRRVAAYQEPL